MKRHQDGHRDRNKDRRAVVVVACNSCLGSSSPKLTDGRTDGRTDRRTASAWLVLTSAPLIGSQLWLCVGQGQRNTIENRPFVS
ncbi:unnamed protein product [Soboliphyme baturini]|uniref:Uncharacterized protein n=1 Tax=Soboliphyme baturini TaxID=241478 RepID=A0A183IUT1_9BILA|nr:unnamed protein product [Soboliphyme baturini]